MYSDVDNYSILGVIAVNYLVFRFKTRKMYALRVKQCSDVAVSI